MTRRRRTLSSSSPTTTRSIASRAAATLLLLAPSRTRPSAHVALAAVHVPFGYQSDSTHSVEYRTAGDASSSSSSSEVVVVDPSSYAGSIRYDPLHHALYVTGATFASQVFDGVDVYELTTVEASEKNDNITTNDGYWWNDMVTGLAPHLEDVGVPSYGPGDKGDCFYAVMGLPGSVTDDDVKVIHSRRFGSEGAAEACSAMDVLPASPREGAPGGYVHEFELEEGHGDHMPAGPPAYVPYDEGGGFGPEGPPSDIMGPPMDYQYDADSGMRPPDYATNPEYGDQASPEPTASPSIMEGGFGPEGPPSDVMGPPMDYQYDANSGMRPPDYATNPEYGDQASPEPTASPSASIAPQSRATETNTGPQSRVRALAEAPSIHANARRKNRTAKERRKQRSLQTDPVQLTRVPTRSVRLLMAGHVESPPSPDGGAAGGAGYVLDALDPGTYDSSASVYAFAQQVDVRLPAGDHDPSKARIDAAKIAAQGGGVYDGLLYDLRNEGMTEEEFAIENELGHSSSTPDEDFERIVTSGVESRALLNEDLPANLRAVYPVALAADATDKAHYYVLLLASEDDAPNAASAKSKDVNADPTIGMGAGTRSWSDFEELPNVDTAPPGDPFGKWGRPGYGRDFRTVVKKMRIDGGVAEEELTAVDLKLAGSSHAGHAISMRQAWSQEFLPDGREEVRPSGLLFAPSGDVSGKGDVLVVVGTTAGRGDAFGLTDGVGQSSSSSASTGDGASYTDLDGFVTKIEADGGEFAGREKLDVATDTFFNTYSKRIGSNPGRTEIAAGVCAKPLRSIGAQDATTHVYVVGSTAAELEGSDPSNVRSPDFLSLYSEDLGYHPMEAFLMKIDLSTMNVVWTQQVGAYVPGTKRKGDALGYGCAVTPDGEDVYLSGLVKAGGIATDFSDADFRTGENVAEGGTDVFVASYATRDGARNFVRQIGSTRDDFPSRGDGGIASDRFGNAILAGNTRGSLLRARDEGEYRYGARGDEAASDVFVLSLERGTGRSPKVTHDGVDARVPTPEHLDTSRAPASAPQQPPVLDSAGAEENGQTKNGGSMFEVVWALAALTCIAAGGYIILDRRIQARKKEADVLKQNNKNLHDSGHGGESKAKGIRNWSRWGRARRDSAMEDFHGLDIMVEVRNSASGGWHGVYDDEQLQAIDFGVPSSSGGAANGAASGGEDKDGDGFVENSLFMEDGLKEIEDGLDNYEIGDMDDVSDEDLIRAYNEAMALDIEPENEDVEFAMAGIGSGAILDGDNEHQII